MLEQIKRIMKRVLSSSTVLKYYTFLLVHIIPLDFSLEPRMLIDLKNRHNLLTGMAFNLDNFLVSPGGGRDYTYSSVGVNATLDCKVASNDLSWSINNIEFDRPNERNFLHNKGIFQSELVPLSDGLSSTLFVFGYISNNASMVCCQIFLGEQNIVMSCTTLIVYGKLINFTSSSQSRLAMVSKWEPMSQLWLHQDFLWLLAKL